MTPPTRRRPGGETGAPTFDSSADRTDDRESTGEPVAMIPDWVAFADISHAAVRVYAALALHADENGAAWAAVSTLAETARMSERHVRRALAELERIGAITRGRGIAATGEVSP